MKAAIALFVSITALPVFAGEITDAHTTSPYVVIGGGYYASNYQANYTNYSLGTLTFKASYNDANSNGYGQLGLGASTQIGRFALDHQLSIGK